MEKQRERKEIVVMGKKRNIKQIIEFYVMSVAIILGVDRL